MFRMSSALRRSLFLAGLLGVVLLFAAWTEATRPVKGPHSTLELSLLRDSGELPWVVGTFFATAGRCAGCHGHDINGIASVDPEGNDVNLVDDCTPHWVCMSSACWVQNPSPLPCLTPVP